MTIKLDVEVLKVDLKSRATGEKDVSALKNTEIRPVFRSFVWADLEIVGVTDDQTK